MLLTNSFEIYTTILTLATTQTCVLNIASPSNMHMPTNLPQRRVHQVPAPGGHVEQPQAD